MNEKMSTRFISFPRFTNPMFAMNPHRFVAQRLSFPFQEQSMPHPFLSTQVCSVVEIRV